MKSGELIAYIVIILEVETGTRKTDHLVVVIVEPSGGELIVCVVFVLLLLLLVVVNSCYCSRSEKQRVNLVYCC